MGGYVPPLPPPHMGALVHIYIDVVIYIIEMSVPIEEVFIYTMYYVQKIILTGTAHGTTSISTYSYLKPRKNGLLILM
jgi:hypothetical protein